MKALFPIILFFYCSFVSKVQSQDMALAKGEKMMQNHQAAFEENKGQVQGDDARKVRYFYKEGGMSMFLLPTGIAYQFNRTHYPEGYAHLDKFAKPEEREKMEALAKDIRVETYRMDIELLGANPQARISVEGKSADYIQYYNHDALDVHSYSRVTYHDIYPNIDWVLYKTAAGDLKYDFVVRAGGDAAQIRLKTRWVEDLALNEDGGITLKNRMGSITEKAPVSLQNNQKIATRFVQEDEGILRFDLGEYDRNQTLIIDPNLLWATYYGGTGDDRGYDCAVDGSSNVYLAGETSSSTAIASGGHQNTYPGSRDAFLVKFNSMGIRQWATYYGGTGNEYGNACAIDATGNVYLAGGTGASSALALGGHQNVSGGSVDAFLVKFNSMGIRQWATYYGGTANDYARACAIDPAGNVYLGITTLSTTAIAFGGHQNTIGGGYDAGLVKFNSAGTLLWATYYGGTQTDESLFCATDAMGNVYLTGRTSSTTAIAFGGHQNTYGGNSDAFLVKFDTMGVRQWATYYGNTGGDDGYSCATDAAGNVYLAGATNSNNSIALGGHQNTRGGGLWDAFLVKFSSAGTRQWATYYGGTEQDFGYSCATDAAGNVYLVGQTESTSSIALGGYQNTIGGIADAFLVRFDNMGVRQWATYYGGMSSEYAQSCAIDGSGNVYLTIITESISGMSLSGHQNIYGGGIYDAFLAKFRGEACSPAQATSTTITQSSCTAFTLNAQTYTTSGTYTQNSTNTAGCDSIITLNFTRNLPTAATITQASCSSFTLNGTTYNSSGTYTQTRTNTQGCDSTITLIFTRNLPTSTTITQASCTSFTLNAQTYTTSGTYTQTRSNAAGCDSIITLNFTRNLPTSATITQASCTSLTLNGTTYTSSGTYTQTRSNAAGCDSIITLNFTRNLPTAATITQASCTAFTLNDSIYSSSGTYTQTLTSATGCDSTITLNLTINAEPIVSITQSSTSLQATTGFGSYVWSLNGTIISNTSSSHNATANGTYQVTVTDGNGCQNTANINYAASNISQINAADFVKIYPNPSEGIINIRSSQQGAKTINIYDNLGRLVYQNNFEQTEIQISLQHLPSAVYQIQIIDAHQQATQSLILAK